MYSDHTVGVVVPAYNESGHVGGVLRAMPSFVDRIYAVDDRSTDDTWTEISDAATDIEGGDRASPPVLEAPIPGGIGDAGTIGHDDVTGVVTTNGHGGTGTTEVDVPGHEGNGTGETDGVGHEGHVNDEGEAAVQESDGTRTGRSDVTSLGRQNGTVAGGQSGVTVSVSGESHGRPPTGPANGRRHWTAALAARANDVRPDGRVVSIRHDENRGAGGAIKTGYLAALADGVDVVVTVDGDGQMDPGRMPRFLDPIVDGEADYTKGDRFAEARSLAEMPPFRLLGNCMLTALTRVASGYWSVSDPQNGYTAVSTDVLEDVGMVDLFEYYGYCNELLVRLSVAGATVRDVPMPATYGDEQSHIDFSTYVPNVSAMLFRNFLWRLVVTYLDPAGEPGGPQAGPSYPAEPVQADGAGGRPRKEGAADGRENGERAADGRQDSERAADGRENGERAADGPGQGTREARGRQRSEGAIDGHRPWPADGLREGSKNGDDSTRGAMWTARRQSARLIEDVLGR